MFTAYLVGMFITFLIILLETIGNNYPLDLSDMLCFGLIIIFWPLIGLLWIGILLVIIGVIISEELNKLFEKHQE